MFEPCEYYSGPDLNDAALDRFEQEHRIRFPKALRTRLLSVNGGRFRKTRFRINGAIRDCPHFLPIAKDEKAPWNTLQSMKSVGAYQELSGQLGDLSKVFLFCDEGGGCTYFALSFNDQPASIWYLSLDETGTAEKVAASWEEFLGLQYDGDEQPSVAFGAGWSHFKILFKRELNRTEGHERSILGLHATTLRYQHENQVADARSFQEVEWDATQSRASVQIEGDSVIVRIDGDGTSRVRSCEWEDGKWFNSEAQGMPGCSVSFDSLEDALLLFKEIDGISTRYGLRARGRN